MKGASLTGDEKVAANARASEQRLDHSVGVANVPIVEQTAIRLLVRLNRTGILRVACQIFGKTFVNADVQLGSKCLFIKLHFVLGRLKCRITSLVKLCSLRIYYPPYQIGSLVQD